MQDVVVAGLNRDEIGLLVFPRLDACRAFANLSATAPVLDVLAAPEVRDFFQRLIDGQWAAGTGSATRVARAIVMAEPPSIGRGEVTDKGSINQRAVLTHREALVEHLYAGGDGVILPRTEDKIDMDIAGQAAIVTGGASGLGAATARELARQGAKVAVLDRNAEGAAAVAAEIGGIGLGCDICDSASVSAALEAAAAVHGTARRLMNVAGIGTAKRIVGKDGAPAPLEDFEGVVRVAT